jgi:hypothetical protein
MCFLRTSFHDCRRVLFAVGLQAPCTDDDSSQAHHTSQILALGTTRLIHLDFIRANFFEFFLYDPIWKANSVIKSKK